MSVPTPHAEQGVSDAEWAAMQFHALYESLAPNFGYETRPETAVGWNDLPENNRRLMIAVCDVMLDRLGVERA